MQSHRTIVVLSSLATMLLPASLAANNSMPKAAPDFRTKQIGAAISHKDIDGEASFRVQTTAPATSLTGGIAATDAYLKGTVAGVTKTLPGQVSDTKPVAPEQFRVWLEQTHPRFVLKTPAPGTVLEVKGVYDNSGKTLRALGIPFEKIRGADLIDMPLNNVKVIIADCPGRVPKEAFQRVRDYVARGGFLLSTDWASDNLVEQAFPGYIQADRHKNDQPVYDAEIVKPDPTLFAGTVTNATWKMDIDSDICTAPRCESSRCEQGSCFGRPTRARSARSSISFRARLCHAHGCAFR